MVQVCVLSGELCQTFVSFVLSRFYSCNHFFRDFTAENVEETRLTEQTWSGITPTDEVIF